MAYFLCPFCIRKYNIKKVLHVCPVCGEATMPGAFEKLPVKCKNGSCGGMATLRQCPSCGFTLPVPILELPSLPINVVGGMLSGKTSYITAMLHELSRATNLDVVLTPIDDKSAEHQRHNLDSILKGRLLEGTPSGEPFPQMWKFRSRKRHGNSVSACVLTIYDGSGDEYEVLSLTSAIPKCLAASKAMILAIDSLMILQIKSGKMVDPTVAKNSLAGCRCQRKYADAFIDAIAAYIKAIGGLKSNQKITIPVAVIITKFDVVLPHLSHEKYPLSKTLDLSVQESPGDITRIEQTSFEIRNWLCDMGANSLVTVAKEHFNDICFFGVSSFGNPPKDIDTLPDEIRPYRVLDPILWLLKKTNFVD